MKNLIISVILAMGLVACEVSRPGVKSIGRFSPPASWVMTPEAEALITPAEDGSRWTELSWSEWGELRGREARGACAILTPDNRVVMCDYIREQDKEAHYKHEVYHAELKSIGVDIDDNANHNAPYWELSE